MACDFSYLCMLPLTLLVIRISVRSVSGSEEIEKDTTSWTWKMLLPNVRSHNPASQACCRQKIKWTNSKSSLYVSWSVAWWWNQSIILWHRNVVLAVNILRTLHFCYELGGIKRREIHLFGLGVLLLPYCMHIYPKVKDNESLILPEGKTHPNSYQGCIQHVQCLLWCR